MLVCISKGKQLTMASFGLLESYTHDNINITNCCYDKDSSVVAPLCIFIFLWCVCVHHRIICKAIEMIRVRYLMRALYSIISQVQT